MGLARDRAHDLAVPIKDIYLYRLSVVPSARRDLGPTEGRNGQAGSFTETKKLILMK
jgi:hypothetical protein